MKSEIQNFFKGDIEDSDDTLTKYSHDASVLEVRPELVLFPKDTVDVQNIVKWANENKEKYPNLAITARCAGTCMSGGSIGESIILDFTRYMNQVLDFTTLESIVVQPGMFYRDFEKVTLEKGMILPCFTASKMINAVGGMYGNNSAGERTLSFGKTENWVAESKVVFNDGNVYTVKPLSKNALEAKILQEDFEGSVYRRIYKLIISNKEELQTAKPKVTKNSAGYYLWNVVDFDDVRGEEEYFDLNKLLIGSQGTLGIATEITFKLMEEPKYRKLLVVFLRDINLLPNLVNIILKHKPETLESYDDKTFLLVLKYIWDFIKLLGWKNLFKLVFSFGPETAMTLKHGMPKLILLIEFTGVSQEDADGKASVLYQELKNEKKVGVHLTRDEFEAKKYWTIRHEAFNLIRYHLKKVKSKPFIDDVIVRPEKLPEFFPELYKILGAYKKDMTFAVGGHAGDGNLHIYTLMNPKDTKIKNIIEEVSEKVYTMVARLGGSNTAEHNDGLVRSAFLPKMYNEQVIELFKQTKEIFDPLYVLNPGKKVPLEKGHLGSREYLDEHISIAK
ncbi:MAG: FAD-binding oxidoreductase [bacterium]|nr:FAD-binding oxidoreductase [bacterium]